MFFFFLIYIINNCLGQQTFWCLYSGKYKQTPHSTFESTSNVPLQTTSGRGKKKKTSTANWDHLEALDDRSWRPERLCGVAEGKANREQSGRQRSSCIYETVSWVAIYRQDGNYRTKTEQAWLGNGQGYSYCWVAAPRTINEITLTT